MSMEERYKQEREALQGRRQLSNQIDKKMRALNKLVDSFDEKLVTLNGQIVSLINITENAVKAFQEKEEPPYEPPETIENAADVLKFARWKFGDEVDDFQSPDQQAICRRITDGMAFHYGDIERVNDQTVRHGYSAPDDKHKDAVYLPEVDEIRDICGGSKKAGKFSDNATWNLIKETPWEVNNAST